MAAAQDALKEACQKLVPPLSGENHKGSHGKVAVVGGCFEYTGAPYFSAISALKVGADLSFVVCEEDAGQVIKSYSPELIVLPYLNQDFSLGKHSHTPQSPMSRIRFWLEKTSAVVVGPGLGDNPKTINVVEQIIQAVRELDIPLLVDGSGINVVAARPELVTGYRQCILTPNINELGRLAKAVGVPLEGKMGSAWQQHTADIAAAFGGLTIVSKGPVDVISDGVHTFTCNERSSLRRPGGLGDILSGSVAVFMAWSKLSQRKQAETDAPPPVPTPEGQPSMDGNAMAVCAYGGCLLLRAASHAAYLEAERSMLAEDVIRHLHPQFKRLFDA